MFVKLAKLPTLISTKRHKTSKEWMSFSKSLDSTGSLRLRTQTLMNLSQHTIRWSRSLLWPPGRRTAKSECFFTYTTRVMVWWIRPRKSYWMRKILTLDILNSKQICLSRLATKTLTSCVSSIAVERSSRLKRSVAVKSIITRHHQKATSMWLTDVPRQREYQLSRQSSPATSNASI